MYKKNKFIELNIQYVATIMVIEEQESLRR